MTTQELANSILGLATDHKRFFVAISGPPASGKSTLTESLKSLLEQQTSVSIVAMDGFHYDNSILAETNLLNRKGSPETFDAAGLYLLLSGLQDQTNTLAAPVFDRQQDLARASAQLIQPEDHIILIEGNYLLCNTSPWHTLRPFFNHTIKLTVPEHVLEKRLLQRWLHHDHSQQTAEQRTYSNDLPNARYVIDHSGQSDVELQNYEVYGNPDSYFTS